MSVERRKPSESEPFRPPTHLGRYLPPIHSRIACRSASLARSQVACIWRSGDGADRKPASIAARCADSLPAFTSAFALQYDGRKRTRDTADYMARIAAERLAQHLEQSGFVLMKRPPGKAPSVP